MISIVKRCVWDLFKRDPGLGIRTPQASFVFVRITNPDRNGCILESQSQIRMVQE